MSREDMVFTRSNTGIRGKYNEAMKILEYSIMMVEFFELEEFNNVIAAQLRLILCDTSKRGSKIIDNSLIRKIQPNPQLHQIKELVNLTVDGNSFVPDELFDYEKPRIPLSDWLNQVILSITLQNKKQDITIFDFIKHSANKSGGAHVDASLEEKAFIVDVHSKRVLCNIARGLFRAVGRNFRKKNVENLSYIIEKLNEKASE
ncbi:hypothetical protein CW357_01010 [Rummeliibacillus sp. TYF005]|uniref:hypothetical protein n=1 Tax=Rummeliibacillus sp. TYF005 TaxID=2058214 RepID=UPI000F51C809|nr:hypothetical protein [Rummeliibacillus sp. TYF005]RPJ97276.1 hypothetical protein CW357_01010 [Rummeliibacillus sp. TYF005]